MRIIKEMFPYLIVEINNEIVYIDHPDSKIKIIKQND